MVSIDQPDGRPHRVHAGARTCVGCRRRDDRSVLLRFVAVAVQESPDLVRIVPDPRQRKPGRGAWLHPTQACFEAAVRRRAFARALRVRVRVDAGPLEAAIIGWQDEQE